MRNHELSEKNDAKIFHTAVFSTYTPDNLISHSSERITVRFVVYFLDCMILHPIGAPVNTHGIKVSIYSAHRHQN